MWVTALNGWSGVEVTSFLVLIAVMLLILRFNRAVTRLAVSFTSTDWPPTRVPREDRPERLQELREAHAVALGVWRVAIVLFSLLVIGATVVVLIHGPD